MGTEIKGELTREHLVSGLSWCKAALYMPITIAAAPPDDNPDGPLDCVPASMVRLSSIQYYVSQNEDKQNYITRFIARS